MTHRASRKPAPRPQGRDPISDLLRAFRRIRILPPRLNSLVTIVGVSGMFVGTLAISLLIAITIRATRASDAFNPFSDDYMAIPTATPHATPNPEFEASPMVGWQGTERVTVLVMGVDTRPSEVGYRTRTDTMILLSVDPVAKTASMLSIPRDLYVEVPGFGLERVNTAYPLGGAPLAVETIEYNLGVRINHYAIVDFNTFVTLVDEIGGIDVYVPTEINDPLYPDEAYGYDPFYMPAGMQHMDGTTALKYARTRHQDNDWERARRQQAVIMAIRERIVSLDMLPTLISKAGALSAMLGESVRTDMELEEMIALAQLASTIPQESIRQGVIDSRYVLGYETEQGAQVSIPNRPAIGGLIEYIFWLDGP